MLQCQIFFARWKLCVKQFNCPVVLIHCIHLHKCIATRLFRVDSSSWSIALIISSAPDQRVIIWLSIFLSHQWFLYSIPQSCYLSGSLFNSSERLALFVREIRAKISLSLWFNRIIKKFKVVRRFFTFIHQLHSDLPPLSIPSARCLSRIGTYCLVLFKITSLRIILSAIRW